MCAEEENLQKLIEMTGFDRAAICVKCSWLSRAPQGSGLVMARGTSV
jgi:hypothetical protein